MFSLAVIVDNRNHEFLFNSLKKKFSEIEFTSIPLKMIVDQQNNNHFFDRIKNVNRIAKWVKQNNQYQGLLIFSDYNYLYRSFVHLCRKYKRLIFIYQDGFILFEPWPINFSGLLKRGSYWFLKFIGHSHFISYKSFHTNPDQIFTWGDYFTRLFKCNSSAQIISVGSLMYEKNFETAPIENCKADKFLYYGTVYRDLEKDRKSKQQLIENLKSILTSERGLQCDVKLHPLDKCKSYLKKLSESSLMDQDICFLNGDFLLQEHISNYKFIISEFSTETVFASLFYPNIYFIKSSLNEKHFNVIKDFLINKRIGGNEYYAIDRSQIEKFQWEYFQYFKVKCFEKAIQNFS